MSGSTRWSSQTLQGLQSNADRRLDFAAFDLPATSTKRPHRANEQKQPLARLSNHRSKPILSTTLPADCDERSFLPRRSSPSRPPRCSCCCQLRSHGLTAFAPILWPRSLQHGGNRMTEFGGITVVIANRDRSRRKRRLFARAPRSDMPTRLIRLARWAFLCAFPPLL